MTEAKKIETLKQEPKENKMGTMPVGKLLFTMSLPMIISMLVQAMYNVVDSVFVSHYSADALTAVSTAFPIQNLMIGVATGLGVGLNALISKSLGQKDQKMANESARQGIFLEIIGYFIFLIIGICATRAFMLSQTTKMVDLAAKERIVNYGVDYLSVVCIFSFGIFGQMTFERLLQSTGRTFFSMITQLTGAIINIILDPIFIFGYCGLPAMGAKGAAIATVIGQCIAAVMAILFNAKKNPDLQLKIKGFKPDKDIIFKILGIGIPSVIMVAIGSVMTYLLNKLLFSFTDIAVSVFGIFFKVQSIVFMPVFGLNNGMIPIMAFNYGAKRADRMLKTFKYGVITAVCMMLVGFAVMELFPEQILSIFKADQAMLDIGIPALKIMSISFTFAGLCISCGAVFQALGKGMYSMMVSIARQLLVLIPVAYLLAKVFDDVRAVWWAFPIAEIASVLVTLILIAKVNSNIIKPMKAGK